MNATFLRYIISGKMRAGDVVRQCRLLRHGYHIFLNLREKRNPLKALIIGYVLFKAIVLRYLFGITKLSSYLTLLDKDCTKFVLRFFGAKISPDCDMESHIFIHNAQRDFGSLRIGRGCHIGKDTFFDLRSPIIIEDFVTISMRTTIITHISVGKSSLSNSYTQESAPVRIMKNVYIGANSTILDGVTIGEESLVSACSLVVHDVPKHTIVGGVPAKVLKDVKEIKSDPGI